MSTTDRTYREVTIPARQPAAYIRRSVARRADPGDISRAFQTDTVRALAGNDPALVIYDQDWGKSAAGDKTAERLAFLRILDEVAACRVSTLYAYSCDRLARSVQWSARLLDDCETAGTTIVTSEGRFAPGDDLARQMFHFQAMQNEAALRQMTRKSQASVAARTKRGGHLGAVVYGQKWEKVDGQASTVVDDPTRDVGVVIDAFKESGSYNGAAVILNAANVPTRNGPIRRDGEDRLWWGSSVRTIIARVSPELVPANPRRGARTISTNLAAGLLLCTCGKILTPKRQKGRTGVSYQCYTAIRDPNHPHPGSTPESFVLPWIKAEAARLRLPKAGKIGDSDARVIELTERKRRLALTFADGALDEPTYRTQLSALEGELQTLDLAERIIDIPKLDWSRTPEYINGVLRTLWRYVELDAAMHPVRAEWRLPPDYII
jgi:DNA invertase Pin-like site-specific DNA recombinase